MAAAPAPKHSHLHVEVLRIKNQIDTMISHMHRKSDYTPTREEIEFCAEELIDFLNKYRSKTSPDERFLKTAIIDLTEVPVMTAQMQRIAFLTALQEASSNIEKFLSKHA
jgi:hypothetical protein